MFSRWMYPIYSSAGAVPALGPRIDRLTVLRAIAGIWFPHRQQPPDEVYATGARKRNMNHGLTNETVDRIAQCSRVFPKWEKAVLDGSRAKGNYKRGSDVDLTLFRSGLDASVLSQINSGLDYLLRRTDIDQSETDAG
jgi:hypothetical protein